MIREELNCVREVNNNNNNNGENKQESSRKQRVVSIAICHP